jgi:uncharacterized membrane protein YsdA (DUF1294 family)/cold shock CspA family protein
MEHTTLIRWNDDKGFGFLQPERGKKEIFLHIKALPHYQRRPRVGDRLRVIVETDDSGQLFARSARICGPALSPFTLVVTMAALLAALYFLLTATGVASLHFGAYYGLMSLVTIAAYSIDKGRAEKHLYRIPEKRLHLLELLGGWPGALLAQLFYRHKLQKLSYQAVFWAIVACHLGVGFSIHSHPDEVARVRQLVTATATTIVERVSREAKRSLPDALVDLWPRGKTSAPHGDVTPSSRLSRSIRKAPPDAVIVKGTIKEIRPEVGLVVTLDKGLEGIVPRSTLVENFPTAFASGETIRFAIVKISLVNGQSRAEGLVIER